MLGVRISVLSLLPVFATAFTLRESGETRCDQVNRALLVVREKYLYAFVDPEEIQSGITRGIIPFDITNDNVVHELACQVADAKSVSEILNLAHVPIPITKQMFEKMVLKPYKEIGGARGFREYMDILDMFMKWMDDTNFLNTEKSGNYTHTPFFNLPMVIGNQQIEAALYHAIDAYEENFISKVLRFERSTTSITVTRDAVPGIANALSTSSNLQELMTKLRLSEIQANTLESFFYRLGFFQHFGWSKMRNAMSAMSEALEIVESLGLLELPW